MWMSGRIVEIDLPMRRSKFSHDAVFRFATVTLPPRRRRRPRSLSQPKTYPIVKLLLEVNVSCYWGSQYWQECKLREFHGLQHTKRRTTTTQEGIVSKKLCDCAATNACEDLFASLIWFTPRSHILVRARQYIPDWSFSNVHVILNPLNEKNAFRFHDHPALGAALPRHVFHVSIRLGWSSGQTVETTDTTLSLGTFLLPPLLNSPVAGLVQHLSSRTVARNGSTSSPR